MTRLEEIKERKMVDERYYIDERVGCIAVRDRTLDDPNYHCLEPDGFGVIKYWHGERFDGGVCETCHRPFDKVWGIKEEDLIAANELCQRLNAGKPFG